MRRVVSTEKWPILLWLDDIEEGAMVQARNLANLPFTFSHVALMPDSHEGFGMPIGGVLATNGVIIPNAVGVDIGCGMCALKTSLQDIDTPTLKKVMSGIRARIPLGFDHHKEAQDDRLMPEQRRIIAGGIVEQEYLSALTQIGTLGGGNHFIEVQKGSDGYIWLMVHSGSRNIGLKVAEQYNKIAIKMNEKWEKMVPKAWQLAFLPMDSKEAEIYMAEMRYCVDFALANRKLMIERIKEAFLDVLKVNFYDSGLINIAHNYANIERHFGAEVIVHRKGATSAREGEVGIIPGSQGSKSYIVCGKGNPESFMSCSHGAGRVMSRHKAIKDLNLEEEIAKLDRLNIIHSVRSKRDLDEAPSAYRSIDLVMQNQTDLVDITLELTPLAVIKG